MTRWLPLGLFVGLCPALPVPDDGLAHGYEVEVRHVGPSVRVRELFAYRKNAEAAELRVATANIEYGDGMQKAEELANAVDLLGRGPDYLGGQISYRDNRGRWRWEADLLNFNEMHEGMSAGMLARLDSASAIDWNQVTGDSINCYVGCWDRDGYLFLNERAGNGGSPAFSGSALSGAGCDAGRRACWVADSGGSNRSYYTVPARGAARRITGGGGYSQRPIGVFHLYLPSQDNEIGERDGGMTRLISKIAGLMRQDPFAFNSAGSTDPRHEGNRIIILGDSNMANHQCSEVNTALRKLRGTFGYAIDVSMALTDNSLRTFDMHYSGAPLSAQNGAGQFIAGWYGNCSDPLWSAPRSRSANPECPFHFKHYSIWNGDAPAVRYSTHPDVQWHNWWAGPSSGNGGSGSRLDIILLAGLGWADDDPVREYLVATNREASTTPVPANPMAGYTRSVSGERRAIEIRHFCGDSPELVSTAAGNYAPQNIVCTNEPGGVGHTVYRSDHKPVGARLRTLFGR